MERNASLKERRGTFSQPRPLTQSEIASLRQDAISTSAEMKALMVQRLHRQKESIRALTGNTFKAAAE